MTLPDSTPKLSKWFFLLSDVLLVAAATFIASRSATPLSNTAILSIVGCVVVGAIVTAWAFIADYTRKQDETIDDRQRALESLARTVATSAEQISIAVGSLHQIMELAQKNLRHAEQLPHKLQEKIAEFQAQLANVNDVEKEELEKELVALRTTESERLEAISDQVAKSTAEWVRLEAANRKNLAASTALVEHAAGDAIARAQTAVAALDTKLAAALAALDVRLSACTGLVERALEATAKTIPATGAQSPILIAPTAPTDSPPADVELTTAHPPKRPRKPRREEPSGEEPVSEPPHLSPTDLPPSSVIEEPPPVPVDKIPEITPVAPHTAEPFSDHATGGSATAPSPTAPPADSPSTPKPPRKRSAKKPADVPLETEAKAQAATKEDLALDLDETPAAQSAEVVERVLTSDGATRLLVTAYIGIGNRLFIRGAGPGLSWDKGGPLQFVSIGKWRWETADATAPVKFKLYKNDDTECTALGSQSLDPGHQEEVTAAF